jgi:hypothetical protein
LRELATRPLHDFLAADHDRLDALLAASDAGGSVRLEPFVEFRSGILRHIAIEEKRLIPAAAAARGGALPIAPRLKADHGAITALLVPTPTPEILERLRSILVPHNAREEEEGGLYDLCDRAIGEEAAARLVEELRSFPEIALRPFNDIPEVHAHIDGHTAALDASNHPRAEDGRVCFSG